MENGGSVRRTARELDQVKTGGVEPLTDLPGLVGRQAAVGKVGRVDPEHAQILVSNGMIPTRGKSVLLT